MKITPAILAEALYALYGSAKDDKGRQGALRAIAGFMVRRNLTALSHKMHGELERLEHKSLGIIDLEIITSHAVGHDNKQKLIGEAARLLNCEVGSIDPKFKVDKDLIGGFVIRTDERSIDRSVAGRLYGLSKQLAS